jgi:hypothetical protein
MPQNTVFPLTDGPSKDGLKAAVFDDGTDTVIFVSGKDRIEVASIGVDPESGGKQDWIFRGYVTAIVRDRIPATEISPHDRVEGYFSTRRRKGTIYRKN